MKWSTKIRARCEPYRNGPPIFVGFPPTVDQALVSPDSKPSAKISRGSASHVVRPVENLLKGAFGVLELPESLAIGAALGDSDNLRIRDVVVAN